MYTEIRPGRCVEDGSVLVAGRGQPRPYRKLASKLSRAWQWIRSIGTQSECLAEVVYWSLRCTALSSSAAATATDSRIGTVRRRSSASRARTGWTVGALYRQTTRRLNLRWSSPAFTFVAVGSDAENPRPPSNVGAVGGLRSSCRAHVKCALSLNAMRFSLSLPRFRDIGQQLLQYTAAIALCCACK